MWLGMGTKFQYLAGTDKYEPVPPKNMEFWYHLSAPWCASKKKTAKHRNAEK